ncbi:MAG: hypothetical protein L0Z62_48645 [Gemmataceae bacterium]|nr:hypothetical protein [Gemmataceae bacterium]
MSIQFHCPECQELVRVSATLAGLHSRCPSCSVSVPVPEGSEPVASGVREHIEAATRREWESSPLPELVAVAERPPSPLAAPRPETGWRTVRIGLSLEFAATIVALIAYGVASLAQCSQFALLAAESLPGPGVLLVFDMVGVLMGVAVLVALALVLVGRGLACAVPSSTGARGFVIASVVCLGGSVLLGGLAFLLALGMRGGSEWAGVAVLALGVLAGMALLVAHIFFCLFLRGAAAYLGNAPLGTRAIVYLVVSVVLLLVLVVGLILLGVVAVRMAFAGTRGAVGLLIVSQLVQVAIVLPLLAWHCSLVAQTRATVAER